MRFPDGLGGRLAIKNGRERSELLFCGPALCWAAKLSTDAAVFFMFPRVLCVQAKLSIFINCLRD